MKAIAGKKERGIFLKTASKEGGVIYDITPIVEEMTDIKYGEGLL